MKKVELLAIGELKFKPLRELEKKYLQMINYFVKFSIKNLAASRHQDERMIMEKDGEMMLKSLADKDFVIALDRRGIKLDSLGFARLLEEKIFFHPGRIVFLIGGFAGFSPVVDRRIQVKISFSDMTFAHDIFRIVFLEQLYRALTIIHRIRYHR